jgi:hypothetical protein
MRRFVFSVLCAMGIHDEVFQRYPYPHFLCRRKGCDYWKG